VTTSPNELVALYGVIVLPPDVFIFLSPAACQTRADEDVAPAFIAGDVMTSVEVEQPCLMAETAPDIRETIAKFKVAGTTGACFS